LIGMWWWVLIWAVLVLCALVYLGARLWTLWGQSKELGRELMTAQERLEAVQGQLDRLGEPITTPEQLAVFARPEDRRRERERTRERLARERRARRRLAHTSRVRHVD
jgi:biopolymer transport protein ExbB/TolQ